MKSAKGLYRFFKEKYPGEKKFYDLIPPLLEKKYLKTIYNCHECAGTLDAGDIDGDGELTVLDIDQITLDKRTSLLQPQGRRLRHSVRSGLRLRGLRFAARGQTGGREKGIERTSRLQPAVKRRAIYYLDAFQAMDLMTR